MSAARTVSQRDIADALLDVVNSRPLPAVLNDLDTQDLATAARFHRIAPLVYRALLKDDAPHAQVLAVDRQRAFIHHIRVSAVLAEVAHVLDGLAWVVFKGPVLSEFAHPVPGLRTYKDVDVLVSPAQFREATQRLFDSGWNVIDSDDDLRNPDVAGELRLASRAGVLLDLHWSMVVSRSLRRLFPVDSEALLDRRVPAQIGPASLAVLDPLDATVHTIQHAALAGAVRMLHLLDADQTVRRNVQDWDELCERARSWGATAQTGLVLMRAQRWLGTPVPLDVFDRLELPPALLGLLAGVDRLSPAPRLRRDESAAKLMARAVRPSAPRTMALVARNAAMGVVNRVRPAGAPKRREPASADIITQYLDVVERSANS